MSIRENGIEAVSVGALLDPNEYSLRIPTYQRPYSWSPATALQLLDDLIEALDARPDSHYVLGAVILLRSTEHDWHEVVDGQQRLLTLRMIIALLAGDDLGLSRSYDAPVAMVWHALAQRVNRMDDVRRRSLLAHIREKTRLVRIETDDSDEAFRVFDSQNYRGKSLAPHDLLKAHHLREMEGESAASKVAVVEAWEAAGDRELDRLFSVYLYRIACWQRGENAPRFSTSNIDLFKGVSRSDSRSPSAIYHRAAQAGVAFAEALGEGGSQDSRDRQRTQFQLGAPVQPGRPFFEMVAHFLHEIPLLAREGFTPETEAFRFYDVKETSTQGPPALVERNARNRYRYVTELYLAALLVFTNKFGEARLDDAARHLFAWAYGRRIALQRVQFKSIDKHAIGDGTVPVFAALRNAESSRVLNLIPLDVPEGRGNHDEELRQVLEGQHGDR